MTEPAARDPQIEAWVERARGVDIGWVVGRSKLRLRRVGVERIGACPRCGGRDRFGVSLAKQVFNCRGCGARGDVIALVQLLTGASFRDAVATLAGEAPPQREMSRRRENDREREAREDEAKRARLADVMWNEAVPIAGTHGAEYLCLRGIEIADVPDHGGLRYHSHCRYGNGREPCILARFTHVITGAPLGVHRRPISIPGAKPKSFGPIAGGVIRLWDDATVTTSLVIGEGVETTLAAATRIEHRGTMLAPAWACGSAGALETLPVLPGIEALTILADHDASGRGQDAASRCAERWSEAGREVTILTPRDVGADFNDLIRWTT